MTRWPVGVEGDLHVDLPRGGRLGLLGTGTGLRLEASRWRDLVRAWRALRRSRPEGGVAHWMARADLGAAVHVRGVKVASLARGGRRPRGWRVHPLGVVRSAVARRHAGA